MAEICSSGVDSADVAGMFVYRLPVTSPSFFAIANCCLSPVRTSALYWLVIAKAMKPIFHGGLALILVVAQGLAIRSPGKLW